MNDVDATTREHLDGLLAQPIARRTLLAAPALAAGASLPEPTAAALALPAAQQGFPDFPDYRTTVVFRQVVKPQELTVKLTPASSNDPDVLVIYSGTLVGSLQGQSPSQWTRGWFSKKIPTSRKWTTKTDRGRGWTLLADSTAMVALADIYNRGESNDAAWAVDAGWLSIVFDEDDVNPADEYLAISGVVGVRDNDGFLYRLSYQATALGRTLR